MSSSAPCKFGFDCRRADCWFSHPQGRSIDLQGGAAPAPTMPSAHHSHPASPGGPSRSSGNPAPCRYGRACHRSECWFSHPEGRVIDEDGPQNEADEALERELNREAEFLQALEDEMACPCCKGHYANCETPSCAANGGVCACQMDAINDCDEEDDSADGDWRDTWFPASRDCQCCKGFVYKCQKQDSKCGEKCSCAA